MVCQRQVSTAIGINPWEYQVDVFTSSKMFAPTQELPENVRPRALPFLFIILYISFIIFYI